MSYVKVTYDDVALMYPDLDNKLPKETVDEAIAKATRQLYRLVKNMPARVALGTLDPELIKDTIVYCVLRYVRNPNPLYQMETELGYSYQINTRTASGELKFLPEELKALMETRSSHGTLSIGLGCPMGHIPRSGGYAGEGGYHSPTGSDGRVRP